MGVAKPSGRMIGTAFGAGRRHDFRLFQRSRLRIHPSARATTDTGYGGIAKWHANRRHPKERSKKPPLSKANKPFNREVSRERLLNEHGIGALKGFRIISDRYRNRRQRFGLRFHRIAGIYNHDLNE